MSVIDHPAPTAAYSPSIQWPAIFAGAVAAAALGFVLHSFAAAVGMGASSTAPTWRDASFPLLFLTGLYLILAALAAYGLGGYVVGRLTARWGAADLDHAEFWDGMRGLLVWALATLMTALVAVAIAMAMPRIAAPSGASPATSVAGENIIAFDLDRLFRSDRRAQADMTQARSEAARILLTTTSHRGVLPEDRAYLVRLVGQTTGLAAPEADRRVTEVSAQAKSNLDRARRSGVLLGFMLGTAALLGAVASWYAACAAGRHRDGREMLPAMWDWGRSTIRS